MTKHQSSREFYFSHKEKIDHFLDVALYKPQVNIPDRCPKKVDYSASRNFRMYSLLRYLMRMSLFVDLSNSKKVLDIGAGYGDFSIYARNYNLEKLDATDPSIYQYNFLKEKEHLYDNVYNLPLQDIDMSEYDTIVMSGLWIPNWAEILPQYIIKNKNLKNVFITATLLHDKNFLILDSQFCPDPAPWKYDRNADWKAISFTLMNLIFKSENFKLKTNIVRKNDRIRKMTSRYLLHYQRD